MIKYITFENEIKTQLIGPIDTLQSRSSGLGGKKIYLQVNLS